MDLGYCVGLDLGSKQDYAAAAVIEQIDDAAADTERSIYLVRHCQRWRLGTRHLQVAEDMAQILNRTPLSALQEHYTEDVRDGSVITEFPRTRTLRPAARLAVDATGVGAPTVERLRELGLGPRMVPVTITSGLHVLLHRSGEAHVPKSDLVDQLSVLFQLGKLQLNPDLPEQGQLLHELQGYQYKISAAARIQFGQWVAGEHDDLLIALALACWLAERPVVRWGAY